MKLIPNTITVSEQFALRNRLSAAINKWTEQRWQIPVTGHNAFVHTPLSLSTLEAECGIRCGMYNNHGIITLTKFEMVNEKKYAWFSLKFL